MSRSYPAKSYKTLLMEAKLTSPKSWNRALSPRKTPPVTGPECRPIRKDKADVSGPYRDKTRDCEISSSVRVLWQAKMLYVVRTSLTSSCFMRLSIFCMQSFANRAIATAWSFVAVGIPQTAT